MPDITLTFPIRSDVSTVFTAMTTPEGLNRWWTLDADGTPATGASYRFGFGPSCQWSGHVTRCDAPCAFEWTMDASDDDWRGTRVGFTLAPTQTGVQVEFYHCGWADANAHFRGSSYCWATYLRVLRRAIEYGDVIPYHERDAA